MPVALPRTVEIPDLRRVERYRRAPEVGPRILFFSGGTALAPASRKLVAYTHNSTHLITPFDSGGSSAQLRKAFRMLAVGDLRNRLMALADQSVRGNREIYELFSHRFGRDEEQERLRRRLDAMVAGTDPLVGGVSDPMRKIIRNHLRFFVERMPDHFDLRGASIGNLILTGGYLNSGRHIDPVIYLFTKLVEARGTVRPTLNKHLHLVARLSGGETLVGQSVITGWEQVFRKSKIVDIFLSERRRDPEPVLPPVREKIRQLIADAELICYPIGSFFTSVVANLLPEGVSRAIGENRCPKVYVPNTGYDPEQSGHTVASLVATVRRYASAEWKGNERVRTLDFVLVDTAGGEYPGGLSVEEIERLGVTVIDTDLVDPEYGRIDPEKLVQALLSLV